NRTMSAWTVWRPTVIARERRTIPFRRRADTLRCVFTRRDVSRSPARCKRRTRADGTMERASGACPLLVHICGCLVRMRSPVRRHSSGNHPEHNDEHVDAWRGPFIRDAACLYLETWLVNDSAAPRSEEHTSELQSRENIVCRLLLEKKK